MKIVANTNFGFLVEMSYEEVANIKGYYSSYENREKQRRLTIGDEIKIAEMYKQLYALDNDKAKIHEYANQIKTLTEALLQIPVPPILEKIDPVEDK